MSAKSGKLKITPQEQKKLDLLKDYYPTQYSDLIVGKTYAYQLGASILDNNCMVYSGILVGLEDNNAHFTQSRCMDVDSGTDALKKKTPPTIVSADTTKFYLYSLTPTFLPPPPPPPPPPTDGGRKRRRKSTLKRKKFKKRRSTRKRRRN